jgi:hypothetical protein
MSELDARYARGQDTRRLFGGGTITSAGGSVAKLPFGGYIRTLNF